MGLLGAILGKSRVQFIQNKTSTIIQFDASLKEQHTRDSPPTEFPIENGQSISDHVIIKPFSLELTGVISDTPIGGIQGLLTEAATSVTSTLLPPVGVIAAGVVGSSLISALSKSKSPSVAAYAQLLSLQANAQPFDVLTSLYRYSSMWIKSISVPRDSDTGKALIFTVSLAQLILVSPQSVNVQIFANPGLSSNLANTGEQGLQVPNGFTSGLNASTKLVGG